MQPAKERVEGFLGHAHLADHQAVGNREQLPGGEVVEQIGYASQFTRQIQKVVHRQVADRDSPELERQTFSLRGQVNRLKHLHDYDAQSNRRQAVPELHAPLARMIAPHWRVLRASKRTPQLFPSRPCILSGPQFRPLTRPGPGIFLTLLLY